MKYLIPNPSNTEDRHRDVPVLQYIEEESLARLQLSRQEDLARLQQLTQQFGDSALNTPLVYQNVSRGLMDTAPQEGGGGAAEGGEREIPVTAEGTDNTTTTSTTTTSTTGTTTTGDTSTTTSTSTDSTAAAATVVAATTIAAIITAAINNNNTQTVTGPTETVRTREARRHRDMEQQQQQPARAQPSRASGRRRANSGAPPPPLPPSHAQGDGSTASTSGRVTSTSNKSTQRTATTSTKENPGPGPKKLQWTTEVFGKTNMDHRRLHKENEEGRDRLLVGEDRPIVRPLLSGRHPPGVAASMPDDSKRPDKIPPQILQRLLRGSYTSGSSGNTNTGSGVGEGGSSNTTATTTPATVTSRRSRNSRRGQNDTAYPQPLDSSRPARSPSPEGLLPNILTYPKETPSSDPSGAFDINDPAHVTARRIRAMQNPRFEKLWHTARSCVETVWESVEPRHPPGNHYHHLIPQEEEEEEELPRGSTADVEKFLRSFVGESVKKPPPGSRNTLGWMVARVNPVIREWFATYEAYDIVGKWVLKHQWGGCWIGLDRKKGWYKVPIEGHPGPGATSTGGRWPGVECLGGEGIREAVGRRIRFLGENFETIRRRELGERNEVEEEERRVKKEREDGEGVRAMKKLARMMSLKRRGLDVRLADGGGDDGEDGGESLGKEKGGVRRGRRSNVDTEDYRSLDESREDVD
ncbi:hypothetical protein TWF281_004447 [Arthrobotrys megalospora]